MFHTRVYITYIGWCDCWLSHVYICIVWVHTRTSRGTPFRYYYFFCKYSNQYLACRSHFDSFFYFLFYLCYYFSNGARLANALRERMFVTFCKLHLTSAFEHFVYIPTHHMLHIYLFCASDVRVCTTMRWVDLKFKILFQWQHNKLLLSISHSQFFRNQIIFYSYSFGKWLIMCAMMTVIILKKEVEKRWIANAYILCGILLWNWCVFVHL